MDTMTMPRTMATMGRPPGRTGPVTRLAILRELERIDAEKLPPPTHRELSVVAAVGIRSILFHLRIMERDGLVMRRVGRPGTFITEAGKAYINKNG